MQAATPTENTKGVLDRHTRLDSEFGRGRFEETFRERSSSPHRVGRKRFSNAAEGERLTKEEVAHFKTWIANDLAWQPGFSFRRKTWKPPIVFRQPQVPAGPGNPIDRFSIDISKKSRLLRRNQSPTRHSFVASPSTSSACYPALKNSGILRSDRPAKTGNVGTTPARSRPRLRRPLDDLLERPASKRLRRYRIYRWRTQTNHAMAASIASREQTVQPICERAARSGAGIEGFIRGIQWRGDVNASQVREVQFAQNVSQVFLGENLKCASCHDSFINDWKLNDAYGLASVIADKPLELVRCDVPTGKLAEPSFYGPSWARSRPTFHPRSGWPSYQSW